MGVHIHAPPGQVTPWWRTDERLTGVPETVVTDCCVRRVPACETVCQIISDLAPPLGLTDAERMDWIYSTGAGFYDATHRIECGPGCGCKVNRRLLRGAAGRGMWRSW